MHNLAIDLFQKGHEVSGSDDEIFEPSKSRLAKYGLLPEAEGWFPAKISDDLDAIILGMHAKADNPELIEAQKKSIRIFSYPEFLYHHARDKKRVVIGGSHGKTTITAMIMHVLRTKGIKFDYMVGSKIKGFDVMVNLSSDTDLMIFEGDEYLTSPIDLRPKFHLYKPHIALLTGIAWDHINVFPTFESYIKQFRIFIDLIEKNGNLIYNSDDVLLSDLSQSARKDIQVESYTIHDFIIRQGTTYLVAGEKEIPLKIFGKHNLMNLNGAMKVCKHLGIASEDFYESISNFEGASNRLELVARSGQNYLFKDFAHAPSKVKATVHAVREQFPDHKLVVCLELHTFSSLSMEFISEYSGSLDVANEGCVYFNPHALSLKRLPDLSPKFVKEAFRNKKLAIFAQSKKMTHWLEEKSGPMTIFLMMSSGNFDGVNLVKLSEKIL